MASLEQLLPPQVLKALIDRSFDRRKTAALEVEKLLRRLKEGPGGAANSPVIRSVLVTLARDFATGQTPNHRKGGLIALASAAIGLTTATADHLDIIVPAVLVSFSDPEGRVRYYACESLYNIAKVVRGSILRFFPEIFAGVCRLVADSDIEVKNGASLLDRLLKEIVMEGGVVDMERFVPLLRAHMRSPNPYSRQLLVGWVTSLDTLPGVDMLEHLPNLLEGLFEMLSDGNREIRQQAYSALAAFLEQVGRIPHSDFGSRIAFKPMVETLITFTSREKDKFQRLTALEWLLQFILLGRGVLTPVYHRFVAVVLRCLSDPEAEIISEASRTNSELQALVASCPPPAGNTLVANAVFEGRYNPSLPIPSGDGTTVATAAANNSSSSSGNSGSSSGEASATSTAAQGKHDETAPISAFIVAVITSEIRARDRLTRSSALKWTAMMLSLDPTVTLSYAGLLSSLLANLGDSDDPDVMRLNIEVLARMCVHDAGPLNNSSSSNSSSTSNSAAGSGISNASGDGALSSSSTAGGSKKKGTEKFGFLRRRLLVDLVQLFALNRPLLEAKGALILRRLCLHLDGRVIYCALARILLFDVDNREFSSLMVELLNLILLTAVELTELRELLRGCASALLRKGPAGAAAALKDAESQKEAGSSSALSASASSSSSSFEELLDPTDGFSVFLLLYRTWCVNPVATVALCLLTEAYDLGARLIARFAETTISVGVLLQCDKLVQLLETPIFIGTRLHLTQPHRPDHGHLLRLLYGLLMVLPQGTAYATLRDRLTSVTSLHICLSRPAIAAGGGASGSGSSLGIDGLAPSLANVGTYTSGNFSGLELNPAWGSGLAFPYEGAGSSTSSSASGAGTAAAGFDLDEVFSSFADSQAVYRAALVDDLRARSLLHNARRPVASAAPAAAAAAAASATAGGASAAANAIKAASLAETTAAVGSSQSAAPPAPPSGKEEAAEEAGETTSESGSDEDDETSSEKEGSDDEEEQNGTETASRR